MYKFLKIIILTSILLFSSCVNDSNPEEFTVREYKKIRKEISNYFENENFTCKNEVDKYEKEEREDSQGSESNKKYIEPTVCRKITEKKIDGNIYKSEITYTLRKYYELTYYKDLSKGTQFYLSVENSVLPSEKYSNNNTIVRFHQNTVKDALYFNVESYEKNSDKESRNIYIWISSFEKKEDEYDYYKNVFKYGLPNDVKEKTPNPEEVNDYFDLLVEKGYVENLLDENKLSKEEADEIAKRFEKSEIYDKIYNLKY